MLMEDVEKVEFFQIGTTDNALQLKTQFSCSSEQAPEIMLIWDFYFVF